jgi:hypothetical protein
MEHRPHPAECISWNGSVVSMVLTLIMFSLCLATVHMVNIELSFVYSSIGEHREVE